jgi:hypothetical protein
MFNVVIGLGPNNQNDPMRYTHCENRR